eukprot:6485594-Amphidinium_carterae.1
MDSKCPLLANAAKETRLNMLPKYPGIILDLVQPHTQVDKCIVSSSLHDNNDNALPNAKLEENAFNIAGKH